MDSLDSGLYQLPNNESSSRSLLSSMKGISVTGGVKGSHCLVGRGGVHMLSCVIRTCSVHVGVNWRSLSCDWRDVL